MNLSRGLRELLPKTKKGNQFIITHHNLSSARSLLTKAIGEVDMKPVFFKTKKLNDHNLLVTRSF